MPGRDLRIGVVTAYPPSRGSLNEYGLHLVRRLADNPAVSKVVVLADEDAAPAVGNAPEGVVVRTAWKFNDATNAARIVREVRRSKVDAVLFNVQFASFGDRRAPAALGLLAPAALSRLGVPSTVLLHNLIDRIDLGKAGYASNRLLDAATRRAGSALTRALLRADLVSVTIPAYVEHLRANYGAGNVVLTPHGTFDELPEPSFELPPGPPVLLAFGKFGTYKRVEILIEAAEIIRRGGREVEVVVAGTDCPSAPGYIDRMRAVHGDSPHVRFTGYVPEEEVADVFAKAAVAVFPYSSTTGSSGVLHQAASFGKAAVLPAIGDFVDVVRDEGYVGEVFAPDDPADLASALERLLDDPAALARQGRRNWLAASGVPMREVADWHLLHLRRALQSSRATHGLRRSPTRRASHEHS